ncbi:Ig-like domain-containing protein [uncultured Dietzia sp.]|uniref:Ig-like domain-containing protein n=1 Tax=uncultured Dietzia sp. TaxID=395519 RepID=UPI0025F75E42|nr:Ig-like domain-containing protein [uncultured Dietzia sp.]
MPLLGLKCESRDIWLRLSIPNNAMGGQQFQFGAELDKNRTSRKWAGVNDIIRYTLPAVATTTQAVTVSPGTGRVGEDVTLSTRVTANHGTNTPTGTVRFTVDGQTRTASVVNGVATTTTSFSTTGSKPVTATFVPSNTNQWSGSSRTDTVNIRTEATQTNLALDPVEVLTGGTVQASASVNPAGAEGEIEFSAGGDPVRVPVGADGSASAELPADSTGEMTVTATFIPADPQRYTSSSDSQTVDVYEQTSTSTEVTVDADPVQAGQETTLTAAITPETAAGTISFTIDGQSYPTTVSGGIATLEHTFLVAGQHVVVADFSPTDTDRYLTSSDQVTVNVESEATQTALTLDPIEVTAGGEISATAQITPADADGRVRFDYADQTRTLPVPAGEATATFTAQSAGTGTVTATFLPANPERYAGSSDSQTVDVTAETTQTDLTLNSLEVTAGGTVLASAAVTPAGAAGTVEFTAGEDTVSVPVGADGTASAELPTEAAGLLTVTATFVPANPDRYTESTDSQSVDVQAEATETVVTVDTDPVRPDEETTLTATVTPADAVGTVLFTIDEQTFPAQVTDGIATLDHTFAIAGNHVVDATFTPTDTGRYNGSTGQMTVHVETETTQTALSLDPAQVTAGGEVTATARITPAGADGQVRFDFVDQNQPDQSQTVDVTGGQAVATFTAPAAGAGVITATFIPADPQRYTGSSDTRDVDVEAESTQVRVTAGADPARVGEETTLTATVTPSGAAGAVTFRFDDDNADDGLGGDETGDSGREFTVDVIDGSATLTHTFPAAGDVVVVATYSPTDTARYAPATGQTTVIVEGEAVAEDTSVSLDAPDAEAGEEITLTAEVTPADAEGAIRFTINGEDHLVPLVDGVATLTHVAGERGSYTVRAQFVPADPDAHSPSEATEILTVVDDGDPGTGPDPGTDEPTTGSLAFVGLVASLAIGAGSSESLGSLGS